MREIRAGENSDLGALLVFDVNKILSIVPAPAVTPLQRGEASRHCNAGAVAGLVPATASVYARSKTIELAPTN
jgi:hypothetical protein